MTSCPTCSLRENDEARVAQIDGLRANELLLAMLRGYTDDTAKRVGEELDQCYWCAVRLSGVLLGMAAATYTQIAGPEKAARGVEMVIADIKKSL